MRRSAIAAILIVLFEIAVLIGQFVISSLGGKALSEYFFSLSAASFTLVGALIVWRRPANSVGWVFAAAGLFWGTGDFASAYSYYGTVLSSPNLPFVTLAAWYGEWFWIGWLLSMFGVIPVLFPTGRPLNRRWRNALIFVCGYGALVAGGAMLEDELQVVGSGRPLQNPIGIDGFHDIESGAVGIVVFPLLVIAMVTGLSSIVVRFRKSRGDERQQLKWFAFAVVAMVIEFGVQIVADSVFGYRSWVFDAIFMSLVPTAAAIAILRYRLYDVDVVINRTLVYGLLTALLAGIYVGLVFALQTVLQPFTAESDLAIAASTLAVAGLFRPARTWVQGFIDRRFYRRKVDTQETLERFSVELRDEVDLSALSSRLTSVVAETMQPAHVSLWLREETA